MEDNLAQTYDRRKVVTIDDLPDDVLLTTFDFYVVRYQDLNLVNRVLYINPGVIRNIQSWQSLVHVCQRWRDLVFASPRRLNLQLYCTTRTTVRTRDIWPALPLLIQGNVSQAESSVDNVIAELEHSDRICKLYLDFDSSFETTSQFENLWTAMQVPFPELAVLSLKRIDLSTVPVLSDSFLGGSAPRLRYVYFHCVSFPGLPKLLLSTTTHLVSLWLQHIPHSGYISPEAMATCLSRSTSLELLQLEFESPQSSPGQESRRSSPPTRSVLPALTTFWFKGVNEYLEELVARIDTPQLSELNAIFFNDIDFETPELIRLVSRSLTLEAPNEAQIFFDSQTASVKLQPQASYAEYFQVNILCREPDWQLSSVAQICTTSLPLLSTAENLFIYETVNSQLDWKDGIENMEWLELLLPFTAVKSLYLSREFAPRIAPALQEISEGQVLSTLQNLYLEGFRRSESVPEGIEGFISARQLANHPVAVSVWDRKF